MVFFFQINMISIMCNTDKAKPSRLESHLTNKELVSCRCLFLTSRVPLPLQNVNEHMDKVKVQLQDEVKKVASLQAKVIEGEVCPFQTSNTV